MNKVLITMLLVLSAVFSQAEDKKVSEPIALDYGLYLKLTGGTMKGPINCNVNYELLGSVPVTGGCQIIDANGNAFQTGKSSSGNLLYLTTAGGQRIFLLDLGTGAVAATDSLGNGLAVNGDTTSIRGGMAENVGSGSNEITVGGSGSLVSGPFAVSNSLSPSSASTSCIQGQIAWDSNFLYVCTAAGPAGSAIWKSVPLTFVP